METIVIDEDRLKIMLSKQDLEKYHVEGRELDPDNEKAQQALRQILDEVSRTLGLSLTVGHTYVQVYESREGGCEMFVTRLPQETVEETAGERVLMFASEEELRRCCRFLLFAGYLGKSRAYRLSEGRCLWLDATAPITVLEFGREVSAELLPYLAEYGELTVAERAAEILGAIGEG